MVKVESNGSEIVIRTSRVLAHPTGKDKGERARLALSRKREHKRKWAEPEAALILNMHFSTVSPERGLHYAQMDLEIPSKRGVDYYTVVRGGNNEYDALIAVIEEIESSSWFHHFRAQDVRFKVTGRHMEDLYRGYL